MANYPVNNPWDLTSATTTYPVGSSVSSGEYWGASSITNVSQYAIQGQMYTTRMTMHDYEIHTIANLDNLDDIKMRLTHKLAEELWKNKAIEFTKMEDPTEGTHTFTARIFAVPDTMVRILRENGK